MRRKNSGHIFRIILGSVLGILGVLALTLLILAIFAGITRTDIRVGFGTFDIGIAPSNFELIERQLHVGEPTITQRANPASTPACYQGNLHLMSLLAVTLYVQTCDIWANQPRPGAVPTAPVKVYPSPVYTTAPTITAP
jgi:hypothetical protein